MGDSSSQVKVSLNPESPDKLVIVVQTTDKNFKIGSISIPQDLFFSSGVSKHVQWITLFDHIEDDEYDGDFTEEDEDMPRIQVMFQIHNYQHSNTMPVTRVSNPLHQPIAAQESMKLSPNKQLSAGKRAPAYSQSPARELVS